MNTLDQLSTEQGTKLKNKEEVMSHTAISSELTEVTGNTISLESVKDEEKDTQKKYSLVFDLISSILVVVIGLVMYKVTGLYDGVNSMIGKIALGTVISFCYLAVFRHAMYRFR
jgi:F0F1-type ATP synthase assembly protein I